MSIAAAIINGNHDHEIIDIESAIAFRLIMLGLKRGYRPCKQAGCTQPVSPADDHYHCPRCDRIVGMMGHGTRGSCPNQSMVS